MSDTIQAGIDVLNTRIETLLKGSDAATVRADAAERAALEAQARAEHEHELWGIVEANCAKLGRERDEERKRADDATCREQAVRDLMTSALCVIKQATMTANTSAVVGEQAIEVVAAVQRLREHASAAERSLAEAQQLLTREQAVNKALNEEIENLNHAHLDVCAKLADVRKAAACYSRRTDYEELKVAYDSVFDEREKVEIERDAARKRLEAHSRLGACHDCDQNHDVCHMCVHSTTTSPGQGCHWRRKALPPPAQGKGSPSVLGSTALLCDTCASEGSAECGEAQALRGIAHTCSMYRAKPLAAPAADDGADFSPVDAWLIQVAGKAMGCTHRVGDFDARGLRAVFEEGRRSQQALPPDVARVVEAARTVVQAKRNSDGAPFWHACDDLGKAIDAHDDNPLGDRVSVTMSWAGEGGGR